MNDRNTIKKTSELVFRMLRNVSISDIRNLAERVSKMGEAEIGNIMAEEGFSKNELREKYVQIAEDRGLYSRLGLKDSAGLRLEEDRNRIWVFAYLINLAGIGVLPLI